MLHLNLPADYYAKRVHKVTARLEVTIDWSDAPSAETQDLDILIVGPDGSQVGGGETDNISSGDPKETAVAAAPVGGDYRLITAGIIGSVPSYTGTVRLILLPDEPINTVTTKAIKFGPASVVNPTMLGGEPLVISDPSVNKGWWIDWPVGTRSNTGQLFESTDDGDTWRQIINARCPVRRQPGCLTAGGGDTYTAVSKGGVVYWANQEGLANEAVNVSTDHGMTWPMDRENAITSIDATNDRQWVATYGNDTAWISASVLDGTGLARTDDGGKTWQALEPVVAEVPGSSGPMAVDETGGPNQGTLYMLSRASGLSIHVSRDKGETFTSFPNSDAPNTGPAAGTNPTPALIPWMHIDRAGNLYVVWVDGSDSAVHMTTMKASDRRNAGAKLGSTWSKPVAVSIPPATSTVFAQVEAGDPGRIGITYQGAATDEPSSTAPAATPWFVYLATSTNALCQWDRSCPIGPAFRQARVSERANHLGNVCVSGLGCTIDPNADRSLLDFFDLGADSEGRVGITWTDDNHGIANTPTADRNGYILFAKMTDGPSLRKGKPNFGLSASAASAVPGVVAARKGNAVWPINEPGGRNFPTLDLTGASVRLGLAGLSFKVNLASTADLADGLQVGTGTQHVKYLTRWSFKNDVYFVAADTTGDEPSFYGGKIDDNDPLLQTGVTSIYGTTYAPDFDVAGKVVDGVLEITVPLAQIGNPRVGDRLYSLQSFTMVGPDDGLQTIYNAAETIDATPPIDYTVGAKVLRAAVKRQVSKPKPKTEEGHLPATGVADARVLGAFLMAASAFGWRRLRRATI